MLPRTKVEKIIGKSFADRLDEEMFAVSPKWTYSRREMVEVIGCANFIAAAKLSKILRKLGITTAQKLFDVDPVSLARVKGIGESSMFVALCVLEVSGHDVEKWWGYKGNNTKFSTFKHHAMSRASRRKQDV